MRTINVGMIQMGVVFCRPDINLKKAEELVKQAADAGAQICVLPECMDLGWGTPKATEMAEPIPGKISDALCRIAKENRVYLVSGLTEKADDKVYNTALLISDEGEILSKHRKINVLTGVEDVYAIGDRLSVTETGLGKIGIDICADNAVQSLSIGHTLARMGAEIILSPCAWAVLPDRDPVKEPYGNEWHVPYSHLSEIYRIPIIGVSNVGKISDGTWKGWKAIGNSIAYGKEGKLLKVLPYGEDAECVEVLLVEVGNREICGTELAEYVYEIIRGGEKADRSGFGI